MKLFLLRYLSDEIHRAVCGRPTTACVQGLYSDPLQIYIPFEDLHFPAAEEVKAFIQDDTRWANNCFAFAP